MDSAQQQPRSIATSEEEKQVGKEKNVDGATIAINDQEKQEVGEGFAGNLDDANEYARDEEEEKPKEEEEEENNQVGDGFGGNLDVDIQMEKKNGVKDARVDQRRRCLECLRSKVDIDNEINPLKAIDSPFCNIESTKTGKNLHGFSDERFPRKETMWSINDPPSNLEAFALEDNMKLPDLEKDQYWSSILFGDQKADTLYLVGSSTASNDPPSTSEDVGFAVKDLPSLDEAFCDDDLEQYIQELKEEDRLKQTSS